MRSFLQSFFLPHHRSAVLVFSVMTAFSSSLWSAESKLSMEEGMAAIDQFLGPANWEASFEKPQAVQLNFEEKSAVGTSVQAYRAKTRLKTADVLEVISSDLNDKPTSAAEIQKSDWLSLNGNWVRFFVRITETYGFQMSVTSLAQTTATVMLNGANKTVPALKVELAGKSSASGVSLVQTFLITNQIRGAGGVLLRQENSQGFTGKVQRSHIVTSVNDL